MTTNTRVARQIRRAPISVLSLLLVALAGLAACGGGGGGSSAPPTSNGEQPSAPEVKGSIELPAPVTASDITIVSNGGEAKLTGSTFAANTLDTSLSLVQAISSDGKLVLLGYFKPGVAGQTLNARSSAEALLFLALNGSQFAPIDRARLHDAIASDPITDAIAATIKDRLAANAFAIDEPDAAIVASIQAAVSSAKASSSSAVHKLLARRSNAMDTDVQPMMLIDPSGEVNGIAINQADETPGFTVTNNKRRRGIIHVYKVGYTPEGGERFDLALAERVGEAIEVSSTESLTVLHALSDVLDGTAPWSPTTSAVIPLTMQSGAERTFYEIVYLTPVYDQPEPAFFLEVRYSLEREPWRQELRDMYAATQFEMVSGAILEALGIGGITYSTAEFNATIAAIRAAASGDALALIEQAYAGSALIPGVRSWLAHMTRAPLNIVEDPLLRAWASNLAQKANAQLASNIAAGSVSRARALAFHATLRVLLAVNVVTGIADTAAQYRDVHNGDKATLFKATLLAPKVAISPSSAQLSKGSEMTLTARLTGAPQDIQLAYVWTLTGNEHASLDDRAGQMGRNLDTQVDHVVLATTPSTEGTLTVGVEVLQVREDGTRKSLGKATSEIVMDDTQAVLSPASALIERVGGSQQFTFTITPEPTTPSALSYEWSCPSEFGSITTQEGFNTSTSQTTATSSSASATYAGRDGLAGGESETIRVTAFYTTPDPQTGEPHRVDVATASADVTIKQPFNIQFLSVPDEVPTDTTVGITAGFAEALPAGARVTWDWLHSGTGTMTRVAGDADARYSMVQFSSGSNEDTALFTVSAHVEVPGDDGYTVNVRPVTRVVRVRKDLRTMTFAGSWTIEVTPDPGTPTRGSVVMRTIVPKIAGAKSYSVVLDDPTGDPAKGLSFPYTTGFSPPPSPSSGWEDRGGAYFSGGPSYDGPDPGGATAWIESRFFDMTVTVTVTF
ncbi:MAG TPA: hypothetical protein VFS47_08460 [Steroidobacteraceae bacterium]|nr:hypothetical protein [Steroidobacteraceae bacterium]